MVGRILISAGMACALLAFAGAAEAKHKKTTTTTTTKAAHIYSQAECGGMKTMHWDDATHTCQKNPKK
jgi:hypothetical protein